METTESTASVATETQTSTEPTSTPQQTQSTPAQVPAQTSSSEPWYSSLPEDLRADANITKFSSVEELAKGYNNASALIGRDKIPMPKTEEEMRNVQLRLGMPATPEEYKLGPELGAQWTAEDLEDSPEPGVPLDKWRNCYKQLVHEYGFTQTQAAKMYERVARETNLAKKREQAKIEAEMQQCDVALKSAWGEAHGLKLQIASRAVNSLFGTELKEKIDKAGLGRDPEFLQAMAKIGSRSLEELGIDAKGSPAKTPSDLDSEIKALIGHPAYMDKKHPEHKGTVAKVTALMQRRHPENAT